MKIYENQIDGHIVAQKNDEQLYIQKGNTIYEYYNNTYRLVGSIKEHVIYRIISSFRLGRRLLCSDIRAASFWDDELVFAHNGALYRTSNNCIEMIVKFREGMRNPLSIASIENISGFENQICFGEYFSNDNRDEVSIWSYRCGICEKKFTFPAKTVRHIHGIVPDKYRNCVYILTGDDDSESVIWKAEDNFKKMKSFICRNQQSRCCILKCYKDCLVYVTDSEYAQNAVYKIVHGALTASLISTVLGNQLPGNGTIYMEQQSCFVLPVRIGDTLTAIVEIIEINGNKATLNTIVENQHNEIVLKGNAKVRLPD